MKILLLDIETSPNTAFVWSLWKENIPLARLIESSRTMCWSAKWYGEKHIMYMSEHECSPITMLKGIHKLLDEADAVVHYNGTRFDIPVLNKEFLLYGLSPPAPSKEIDLLKTCRNRFKFTSNKLDYVAQFLGLGQKKNTTFELWVKCMEGDPKAWKKMKSYNKHDVLLLERVYVKLLPWIKNHANVTLYDGGKCPACGHTEAQHRGWHYTSSFKYRRYSCKRCSHPFRSAKAEPNDINNRFRSI